MWLVSFFLRAGGGGDVVSYVKLGDWDRTERFVVLGLGSGLVGPSLCLSIYMYTQTHRQTHTRHIPHNYQPTATPHDNIQQYIPHTDTTKTCLPLLDLRQQVAPLQVGQLGRGPEDGHVGERPRQDGVVGLVCVCVCFFLWWWFQG